MEITNISYFKKSHAPDVSIIVPKYPSQDVRNANVIESKDYVIHGERLELYFLVSFESLKRKWQNYLENGGQKAPHIIKEKQRALYIAYCNLKFDIRLEHSSSEIFSTSNHHIIGYRNIIDLKPNAEDKKKILELIDDQIGNVEVGECILLSNGDLLYPLRVVMDVMPKYIGEMIDIIVKASPKVTKYHWRNGSVPDNFITDVWSKQHITTSYPVIIIDPLQMHLRSSKSVNKKFITATLRNHSTDTIEIENASLHMTQTEFAKKSVNLEHNFKAKTHILDDFPIKLQPKEAYSFVIESQTYSNAEVTSAMSSALYKPSLVLSWSSPALSTTLVSQHLVPLEPLSQEQVVVSFEQQSSPIKVNTIFDIKIVVSNLSENHLDLALHFPYPEVDMDHKGGVVLASRTKGNNKTSSSPTLDLYKEFRKNQIGIYVSEKTVMIGEIDQKEEKFVTVKCIALMDGLYEISGIKITNRFKQEDIQFVIPHPLEILVVK